MAKMETTRRSVDYNPSHIQKAVSDGPMKVDEVKFTPLPTQMSYTEYSYNSTTQELKIHVWLYSPLNNVRRFLWEKLADSFTSDALKWTEEAMLMHPPYTKGSIFVGLKSKPHQVVDVIKRLLELDKSLVTFQVI